MSNEISVAEFKLQANSYVKEDFGELLKRIKSVDENNKALWLEIYNNALADRQNSFLMFHNLVQTCNNKSTEFAVHGRTIASFIERMSKANDQLLRLAEIIRKAEEESDVIDPDEIWDQLDNGDK